MQTNYRQSHLDVICGILIVYMIVCHCMQWAGVIDSQPARIVGRFFFFFMPWFFFKAGMFFNPNQETKKVLSLSVKRLIYPFILYSFIGHIFYCITLFQKGDQEIIHYTLTPIKSILIAGSCGGNLPLWFLLSLFAVRLISNLTARYFHFFFLIFGGLIAMVLNYYAINKPFYLANICAGLFFYTIGFLLKEVQYKPICFIFSMIIYLIAIFYPSIVDMRVNSLQTGLYSLWLLYSIGGCVFFNNFFSNAKIPLFGKILEFIGEKSILYFCTHWIILIITNILINVFNLQISNFSQ